MKPLLWTVFFVPFLFGAWQAPRNMRPAPTTGKGATPNRESSNPESESKNQETPKSPATIGIGNSDNPNPIGKTKKSDPDNESENLLYRVYLWATIIGVAGGLIGLYFIWGQFKATRESANYAAKAFIMAERAHLAVDKWSIDDFAPNRAPTFRFHIINSGHTSAQVTDHAFLYIIAPEIPEVVDYSDCIAQMPKPLVRPSGDITAVAPFVSPITSGEFNQLINGVAYIHIWGRIKYITLGEEHTTCYGVSCIPHQNRYITPRRGEYEQAD